MEKDRSARLIAIVALVLAVTGVSIGFAVLSTNLTIDSFDANVKADDKLFTVYFSSSDQSYQTSQVVPTLEPSTVDGFSGTTITVQANSTQLTGIGGTFTAPGQKIIYKLGVANQSKIKGYLTGIVFDNVTGNEGPVKCEPVTNSDKANPIENEELQTVCSNIKLTVKVNGTEYTEQNLNISKSDINAGGFQPVEVIIEYDKDAVPATGDFKATFGNIKLIYETKDNSPV